MKINSIVVKLWTGIVLMTISILLLSMFFQTQYLYKFYYDEKARQLQLDGLTLSKEISKNEYNFNVPFVNAIKSINDIIIVTDKTSKITYIIGSTEYKKGWQFGSRYIDTILNGQIIKEKNRMIKDFDSLLVGVPIKENINNLKNIKTKFLSEYEVIDQIQPEIIGAIYIISPLEPLETAINLIRMQFLYILIYSIIISSLIAFFLSRSFSKPLLAINDAALQIVKGNYSIRINLESSDEIKTLGKTINDLAAQLSRVETIRKEFIANVSHELRTPLSYLQGYSEVLIDGLAESKEEEQKYLNIIKEETERLRKMVDEILQLSQIEAGFIQPKITTFSAESVIKRTIDKLLPLASNRNISIRFKESEQDVLLCLGDESRIKQVLINLINNAIKHSYDFGNILITANRYNDRIYICVRDFGEGIAEQDLPFIWDRFYTTEKNISEHGVGLGLAIVKNIINSIGSEITVNSIKGEGTEFCFWLPIAYSDN